MTRDEMIRSYMVDMVDRLEEGFDAVVDADDESPQLPLFRRDIDYLKAQIPYVEVARPGAADNWFLKATLLGEQIDAEAALRSASWSQGFLEALGKRYVELLKGLPTPKEALETVADLGRSTASGLGSLAVIAVVAALIYLYSQERGRA